MGPVNEKIYHRKECQLSDSLVETGFIKPQIGIGEEKKYCETIVYMSRKF